MSFFLDLVLLLAEGWRHSGLPAVQRPELWTCQAALSPGCGFATGTGVGSNRGHPCNPHTPLCFLARSGWSWGMGQVCGRWTAQQLDRTEVQCSPLGSHRAPRHCLSLLWGPLGGFGPVPALTQLVLGASWGVRGQGCGQAGPAGDEPTDGSWSCAGSGGDALGPTEAGKGPAWLLGTCFACRRPRLGH